MRVYIKVMAMSLSFHNLCAEAITEENIRYFHVSSLPAAAEVKPPIVSPVNPVPPVTPVKKPPIVPPVNHVPPGPPVKTPPIVPPAPPVTPPIVPLVNPVTPPPSSVPLTSVEGILKDTSD
ncbi:MAG: hypothetical protein Q8Q56_04125, partial [Alphaproteobacteria bacterium]|nr:hypothetical protein [Alphaproteobacteria bacterium]